PQPLSPDHLCHRLAGELLAAVHQKGRKARHPGVEHGRRRVDAGESHHLARATYSAYNAGPGGLARYRGVGQTAVWKKVDDAFWSKFQAVSVGQDLDVKSCYES